MVVAAMQILVVEDDPDVRDALEMSLSDAGYAVSVAGTGGEALRVADTAVPDLVLLDLMLPDRPGEDVYRALRANPLMRGVAVIIVSARSAEHDRVAGLELGVDDYVAKPFSMRLLLLRIEAVLKRAHSARTKAPRPLTSAERKAT